MLEISSLSSSNDNSIFPTLTQTGAFGRRASDGGANLHIFYPTTPNFNEQPVGEAIYGSQAAAHAAMAAAAAGVGVMGDHPMPTVCGVDGPDDTSDEIQR